MDGLVGEWKDGWMELTGQWMDRLMDRQMTGWKGGHMDK